MDLPPTVRAGPVNRQEKVRDVYLTDDANEAAARLDEAIAWCTAPEATPEQRMFAKTLRRWRAEIVAHHTTGASNGPIEGGEPHDQADQSLRAQFRNFESYRLRILLTGQRSLRETQPVTSIRPRLPRLVA